MSVNAPTNLIAGKALSYLPAVLLFALCLFLGNKLHERLRSSPNSSQTQFELLPSASQVRSLSLGYEHILADVYWLGFVQYIGDTHARSEDKNKYAEDYLNLVTALDPSFTSAYWFAAFSVGRDAKRPAEAAKIIERGIEHDSNNWQLPYIAGFNQYLFAHNEKAAAKYYRMAAKCPGSPPWLSRQADILEAKIPSTIKEINTWTSILSSSPDEHSRESARERLITLWTQVYETAPTGMIKKRALEQLSILRKTPSS